MARRDDAELSQEDVEREHHESVNTPLHWLYLFSVLIGSFALMVGLIALLGAGG
jgi:hypothetical protein